MSSSKVSHQSQLPASAEEVWKMIGSFNGLPQWHPGVESSTLEHDGRVRRLKLLGGGEIVEQLEKHDDESFTYSYGIVNSPLPVANYHSTIRIVDDGEGSCKVEWSGEFDPTIEAVKKAEEAVLGIYTSGLDNLKKMLGG